MAAVVRFTQAKDPTDDNDAGDGDDDDDDDIRTAAALS